MEINKISGFEYEAKHMPGFTVTGFTKFVASGGEFYDEVYKGEKWRILQSMNTKSKEIYGIASRDAECPKDKYRYSMGVVNDENFVELLSDIKGNGLFSISVAESDWIVFKLDFSEKYGDLWGKNPYKMIEDLGYRFNGGVGLHIDVFDENYDGHYMEFWMPVLNKKTVTNKK